MDADRVLPGEEFVGAPSRSPHRTIGAPRHARRRLSPVLVIILSYLALIAVGTLLLLLPFAQTGKVPIRLLDSLFTATSAACMCGLVTVSTAEAWTPVGQGIILALVQIGALFYMTSAIMVATWLGIRIGLRPKTTTMAAQGIFSFHEGLQVLRYVALGTLVIEAIGAVILVWHFYMGMQFPAARAIFEGIFYAVCAFCTTSFDLAPGFRGLPFYGWDLWLFGSIGILAALGSLGIAVIMDIVVWPHTRRLNLHTRLVVVTGILLVLFGMVLFMLFELTNPQLDTWPRMVLSSWFMSLSSQAAGYRVVEVATLMPPTLFILGLLMIIGAAPTSTGAGVKTTTLTVIILAINTLLRRKRDIEIFHRRIGGEMVRLALSLVTVYLLTMLAIILGVSFTEIIAQKLPANADTMARYGQLMFEVVSAFGNVGFTADVTPTLTPISQALIAVSMFLGRIGPLAFIFGFAQPRHPSLRRLPAESVMVG